MKSNLVKFLSIAAILLVALSTVPFGRTQEQPNNSYTSVFLFQNNADGDSTYELNVTIPQELYTYYSTYKSHFMYSEQDFDKFVTPYTLKPIADSLWQVCNTTEDFVNAALMVVHQITYRETVPCKYPVEILVAGKGDCDLFAFVAASILEAGGVHAVLLYYKAQKHMEIGVQLPNAPTDARSGIYSVEYQGVPYYIGECTGSKWRDGWRVGECPTDYKNASTQIITLQDLEQTSIGQVSATLEELDPSTITMKVSSALTLQGLQLTITGQVLPDAANENVTLQAKINSPGWTTIGTVQTQADGRFQYEWTPPDAGSIAIQAGWVGNRQYNGAKSAEVSVMVIAVYLLLLIASSAFTVCVVIVAVIKLRRKTPEPVASVPPQDTSSTGPPPETTPPPPPEPSTPDTAELQENRDSPTDNV